MVSSSHWTRYVPTKSSNSIVYSPNWHNHRLQDINCFSIHWLATDNLFNTANIDIHIDRLSAATRLTLIHRYSLCNEAYEVCDEWHKQPHTYTNTQVNSLRNEAYEVWWEWHKQPHTYTPTLKWTVFVMRLMRCDESDTSSLTLIPTLKWTVFVTRLMRCDESDTSSLTLIPTLKYTVGSGQLCENPIVR